MGADPPRRLRVVRPGDLPTATHVQSGDLRARQLLANCLADQLAEFLSYVFRQCEAELEPLSEKQRKVVVAAAMAVLRSEQLWRS